MNIDRRHLVLPALAIGLLGVVPALATSSQMGSFAPDRHGDRGRGMSLHRRSAWPRSRLTPKH